MGFPFGAGLARHFALRIPLGAQQLAFFSSVFNFGGESGIRTHDTVMRYDGFQDRCLQPLGHLSEILPFITLF